MPIGAKNGWDDRAKSLKTWWPGTELNRRRQPFQAKINSDYNDFVARVALEVVDSEWWKQQLRVKTAGQRNNSLVIDKGASRQPLFAFAYFQCQSFSAAVTSVLRVSRRALSCRFA